MEVGEDTVMIKDEIAAWGQSDPIVQIKVYTCNVLDVFSLSSFMTEHYTSLRFKNCTRRISIRCVCCNIDQTSEPNTHC